LGGIGYKIEEGIENGKEEYFLYGIFVHYNSYVGIYYQHLSRQFNFSGEP